MADSIISLNLIQILNPCCALCSSEESLLYVSAPPLKLLLFALHAANQNPKVNYDKKKKEEEEEAAGPTPVWLNFHIDRRAH